MTTLWRPGSGREKTNRSAITTWGATLRLALLRLVSGATIVVALAHIPDVLRAISGG